MQETSVVPAGQVSANRQGKQKNLTREIIDTLVLTLLIFFAVHFSVQPFEVQGPSMQPGLHTGEEVLVNLLAYDFSAPKRGDVVVIYPPMNTSRDCNDKLGPSHTCFVKRIIAVPGDVIQVTVDGDVFVNGKLLSEPYVYGSKGGTGPIAQHTVEPPTMLGKDAYFVMGDNRDNSEDSRVFGPISRSEIIGKASAVILPLSNFEWLPDYSFVFKGVGSGGR